MKFFDGMLLASFFWVIGAGIILIAVSHGYKDKQDYTIAEIKREMIEVMPWVANTGDFQVLGKVDLPPVLLLPASELKRVVAEKEHASVDSMLEIDALYLNGFLLLSDDLEFPKDRYVLVHEMFHHLTQVTGRQYECVNLEKKDAYAAQCRWFHETGEGWCLDAFRALWFRSCNGFMP